MLNIFDFITNSAIENFRKAFFDTTGMMLSFADRDHKQYNMFYAGSRCQFCKVMNSTNKGLEECISTSRKAGKEAALDKKSKIYKCHAGLTEVVVPIVINGEHIGSVFSGQVLTSEPSEKDLQKLYRHLAEIGICDEELIDAYKDVLVVSESKLKTVSELLTIAVDFMIENEKNNILNVQVLKEKEKFNQIIPFIRNELLNYIVNNDVDKLSSIKEIYELLGIENTPNVVLIVKIDDYDRLAENQSEKFKPWISGKTIEVLSNELSRIKDSLIFPIHGGKFVILLSISKNLTAEKKKLVSLDISDRLRKAIEAQMPSTATVGIGRHYDSSKNLGNSYMEANSAQVYGHVAGRNQVIHIDDISDINEERLYHFVESSKLKDIIILASNEKLDELVNESFTQFLVFNEKDINKIKAFAMEFLNRVLNSAIECGLNAGYLTKNIEYFRTIDQFNTYDEIFNWVKDIIRSIVSSIVNTRNTRDSQVIERAKKYMCNNFNKDIRLEDVASAVFLSPNYLGWLFKRVTQMTFIEYLTKIRMERAKYMLEMTSQSIQAISEMVGYNDPNYFSQAFKKYYSIRPSALRVDIKEKNNPSKSM
jgi:AraC-type DNA-binding domain-containing proteins